MKQMKRNAPVADHKAVTLDRATAFNRYNVFYDKLEVVISRFNIQARNISNIDKTAL